MKTVYVFRKPQSDKQTEGFLVVTDELGQPQLTLVTLELPWRNNERGISCYPEGDYIIEAVENSPSFGKFTEKNRGCFHIRTEGEKEVPGREACMVHSANFSYQLRGCTAIGIGFSKIDKDDTLDVFNSRAALQKLKECVGEKAKWIVRNIK